MSCVVKVADYSSRSYWDQRFASESSFEWLQPSSSLLPVIQSELQNQHRERDSTTILHLGSGSSDLSNRLRRLLSANRDGSEGPPADRSIILNVDFAAAAIEIGRRHERAEFGEDRAGDMRWAVVDLLDWIPFKRTCAEHCGRPFDLIIEKSCTDALACGPDVQLGHSPDDDEDELCPPRESYSQLYAPDTALATYLAAVTRPGGAWIALSYSAERFDFLRDARQHTSKLWSVERTQNILVSDGHEGGQGGIVFRPEIVHYVYTMRRKSSRKE